MNVLLFGSDSATHAFAWKLINSAATDRLMVAPGNRGTAFFTTSVAVPAGDPTALANLVLRESIELVIADTSLGMAGTADEFRALSVPVFGASQAAWRLTMSRCATRAWLQRHGLPLARGRICATAVEAEKYAATLTHPVVVAADDPSGPAIACHDRTAIPAAIAECFGETAAPGVIVEELARGPQVTTSLLTDGRISVAVPATRLHFASAMPFASPTGAHNTTTPLWDRIERSLQRYIRGPLIRALQADDIGIRGWLGVTCVLAERGPLIRSLYLAPSGLEAATTLLRLTTDFLPLALACARGDLAAVEAPSWQPGTAIAVALQHPAGDLSPVSELYESLAPDIRIFHHKRPPVSEPAPGAVDAGKNDLTVAIVAAQGADLAATREHLYAYLAAAGRRNFMFNVDIGAREL